MSATVAALVSAGLIDRQPRPPDGNSSVPSTNRAARGGLTADGSAREHRLDRLITPTPDLDPRPR
ncbi:hypothetical protein HQQ80_20060 [Microbacteriaceae bacterium VKM Ac-2855]|nr:hypothetical protein [Microbacteriaceae bacterium VKM Ac-2855]